MTLVTKRPMNIHARMACAALVVATLAVGGCCGGGDDPDEIAILSIENQSRLWVHVLWTSGSRLFLRPGGKVDVDLGGTARIVEILPAPGQGVYTGIARSAVNCCCTTAAECEKQSCGSLFVEDGQPLGAGYNGPTCFQRSGGGGSCPYVYAYDGKRFLPQGEVLSAALYPAMQKVDHILLPDLEVQNAEVKVKIVTALPEIDVIDEAQLVVVDHASDTKLTIDPDGMLLPVRVDSHWLRPTRVRDAAGVDRLAAIARSGDDVWRGQFSGSQAGSTRDDLYVRFAPMGGTPGTLEKGTVILMLQNNRDAEEKLNRFLGELGPGFPSLLSAASKLPGFASSMKERLRESGIAMEVAYRQDGDARFQTAAWIDPVGSLAMRPVAVKLPAFDPTKPLEVRLRALPGTWLLDEVSLDAGAATSVSVQIISPADARTGAGTGTDPIASLMRGVPLRQQQGDAVTLTFVVPDQPAPSPGRARSYALRARGYYELVPGQHFSVDWGLLRERSLSGKDAFARYLRGGPRGERWRLCPKTILGRWFASAEGGPAGFGLGCISGFETSKGAGW